MSHKNYRSETNCLNCGAEVKEKFCPQCGQENLETRENFFHLAFHFVSDYFHFDSKFFRSLVPLFARPGFLTKEYWEGKRVRYIHPLRLYFFVTIIFMLAATYFYQHLDATKKRSFIDTTTTVTFTHEDSLNLAKEPDPALKAKQIEDAEKERIIRKVFAGMDHFFHDLKYISFFMIPVYALAFKLLYIRRKKLYVDQLVYTMHLQSFAYILVGIAFMLASFLPDHMNWVRRIAVFGIFLYIVFSLRYLYHQGWVKTILKSLISTLLIVTAMGAVLGVYVVIYASKE